jgi:hypothetical protein
LCPLPASRCAELLGRVFGHRTHTRNAVHGVCRDIEYDVGIVVRELRQFRSEHGCAGNPRTSSAGGLFVFRDSCELAA